MRGAQWPRLPRLPRAHCARRDTVQAADPGPGARSRIAPAHRRRRPGGSDEYHVRVRVSGGVRSAATPRPVSQPANTGKPVIDACVDAFILIDNALASQARAQPGVAAAIRAAAQAVLRHDWLPPGEFEAVYTYIQPDIPFAELGRR
jgi:hypothetical protein